MASPPDLLLKKRIVSIREIIQIQETHRDGVSTSSPGISSSSELEFADSRRRTHSNAAHNDRGFASCRASVTAMRSTVSDDLLTQLGVQLEKSKNSRIGGPGVLNAFSIESVTSAVQLAAGFVGIMMDVERFEGFVYRRSDRWI